MEIRKATPADGNRVAHLLTLLGYPGTVGFIREKIRKLAEHPDAEFAVALDNDVVVGFILLLPAGVRGIAKIPD